MKIDEIKSLCDKYSIRPSKKFGQNFVVDARITRMVVDAAKLNADDCVVEVGPGLGALTQELAQKVKQVVAVEVDQKMYRAATELLALYKNADIVLGDILKIPNKKLVEMLHNPTHPPSPGLRPPSPLGRGEGEGTPYKVVANLPYSITSAVLRKFTEQEPKPELIVVMVQKEVAQRVCASPSPGLRPPSPTRGEGIDSVPFPLGRGKKGEGMSILSVAVQYFGKPEIVAYVERSAFWPEPEVDSAILRIELGDTSLFAQDKKRGVPGAPSTHNFEKHLFQIVRIGFSSRRKQLQNNLSAGLKMPRDKVFEALKRAGLSARARPQELSVENWIALARLL
ncbi:hypothetical protein A3B21_04530 [Candidatus Uhrbacteria bacterium RIFCSPLOWO2_01_FULL_47_24]|uniref:Ribosomal RNA small subunit methyltransferase A n=1 Tax=Candidatus Uhrbacteria bacterium RIFCSPLOWO2_01_FULL_47_24 TaxID=1802401 RepID=A0A1F7UTV0_9BACT|nr:MAG: hypothetical protein A2753_03400 [Candidatus Uhrbacteria bacterium RIFCSPHIGHO2_01_FULL_47_11]OGL68938.1 MAG: hypothetical protein A3D58_00330 [Candidatus Uhrbacteria bacterium RIFCSPHIGHO2_02_FULL_46_47]OGL81686.1 MAG: hypothetical protein A3B21_04530 [Candidatus Uhrbacteria bacterium RIFCSPLOWO2_01_FULL_47_24]OGL85061.1 MAG: hypothetical protein A3J03_03790 [Candidatus Uhrbacteria bacterium RIFCSPLOWO2_02_FULL_46_25]OGL92764.1 MAG: hypothetical protein A3H11_05410 [Candidatus Uhrbacte